MSTVPARRRRATIHDVAVEAGVSRGTVSRVVNDEPYVSEQARIAIEAGVPMGWEKWIGDQGKMIGLERFGASAPYKTIYEHLGFTADDVVLKALQTIDTSKKNRP